MEKYNVKFKKKLGQNFLKDMSVVERIISVCDIDNNSLVMEVGPGGAIMTRKLCMLAKHVIAYEIDTDLQDELSNKLSDYDNVEIIYQDFLEADLKTDIKHYTFNKLFFVSNVPYYITTPIIMKLLHSNLKFNSIVMMVQKEVGDRFAAKPGTREYGSITVLLNCFFDIKKEFFVSKKKFIPEPKVDSIVISFKERESKLKIHNFSYFEKLVRDSFQFKRKNIRNNLKNYDLNIVKGVLSEYGYDLNVRAETLSVDVFVKLSNELWK